MNPPAADAPPPSIRWEIATAYLAAAAKVGAWALVTALLIRSSRGEFAVFALIRGTLGLLNYTSLGLAPAMIKVLAGARSQGQRPERVLALAPEGLLEYASRTPAPRDQFAPVYASGLAVAWVVGAIGVALTALYAVYAERLHDRPGGVTSPEMWVAVVWVGVGTVLRLMSDAPAAVLQTSGRIVRDNLYLVASEALWVLICLFLYGKGRMLIPSAEGYALAGAMLLAFRASSAFRLTGVLRPQWRSDSGPVVRQLLGTGLLIALAQLADFLYAPASYILINRLLGATTVASYAPAVQIDSALLLVAGGLAAVLLPRAALAHAAGDRRTILRYYLKGSALTVVALTVAALAAWAVAPLLLRLWLGKTSEHSFPQILAILPLVLLHTVIGGSSAVGRSVLLAIGRAKAYAAAALIAGAANVILSFCLVKFAGLGLKGIVYGTIIAVTARCFIWMPWYTLRAISRPMPNDAMPNDQTIANVQ